MPTNRIALLPGIALLCLLPLSAAASNPPQGTVTPPIFPKVKETPLLPPVQLPSTSARRPVPNPGGPLLLTYAIQMALNHQPLLEEAKQALLAAHGRVVQTRSGLLPAFSLGAGYNYQSAVSGTLSGSSTTRNFQSQIILHQLLFDSGHTLGLLQQSDALQKAARAALNAAVLDLEYSVSQAYYIWQQNLQLVQTDTDNLANRRSQLDLVKATVKAGTGLPSDLVNAETAAAQAAQTLSQAQATARISQALLAQQMGIAPFLSFYSGPPPSPQITLPPLKTLLQTALKMRPEMQEAEQVLQADMHALSAARTTNSPSVAATLQILGNGDQAPPQNQNFTAGISITFTPFDNGSQGGLVEQAEAAVRSARAALLAEKLQVQADVVQAYLASQSAIQRKQIAEAELYNAKLGVKIAQGRYQEGLGLFQDILTAQAALVTSQTDSVNAAAAAWQANAQMLHATGTYFDITNAAVQ